MRTPRVTLRRALVLAALLPAALSAAAPSAAEPPRGALRAAVGKGHWLATAEVDGRNGTQEILAVGYGGRIVLLARPPGHGRTELADPAAR